MQGVATTLIVKSGVEIEIQIKDLNLSGCRSLSLGFLRPGLQILLRLRAAAGRLLLPAQDLQRGLEQRRHAALQTDAQHDDNLVYRPA